MSVAEITSFGTQSQLLNYRSASAGIDVFLEAGLSLKTREGDQVDLSFANEQSLSGSQSETSSGDGQTVQEFSSVAVAASRFSLVVQGDLNEDELAAIRKLVAEIEPIIQSFFSENLEEGFDVEQAIATLTNNLGVLSEIELELEKTVVQTLSLETVVRVNPDDLDIPSAASAEREVPDFVVDNIRQLPELVLSSVEAEFEKQFQALTEVSSELILRSFGDLMDFFRAKMNQFLNPLGHPAPDTGDDSPSLLEAGLVASQPQE